MDHVVGGLRSEIENQGLLVHMNPDAFGFFLFCFDSGLTSS